MGYQIIDHRESRQPQRIDYERMRKEGKRLFAKVERARKTGDPVKVANACIEVVRVWDEIGCWPDNWAALQRALDDVLPWNCRASLDDIAYGRVEIKETAE